MPSLKGMEPPCPWCFGNWREKEFVGEAAIYFVAKWPLFRAAAQRQSVMLTFERVNGAGEIYRFFIGHGNGRA